MRAAGVHVIRVDEEVHRLLRQASIRRRIRSVFGQQVFQGPYVSRKKLGRQVFMDPTRLTELEAIVHPILTRRMRSLMSRIKRRAPHRCVAVEAPVFHRAGWTPWFDAVLYVDAPRNVRRKRCLKLGMTADDFQARERCQQDIRAWKRTAHWVINNNRTISDLAASVRKFLAWCAAVKDGKG